MQKWFNVFIINLKHQQYMYMCGIVMQMQYTHACPSNFFNTLTPTFSQLISESTVACVTIGVLYLVAFSNNS